MIPTAGSQEKNPFGFDYLVQWHCHECWQKKNPKDKEAKKDNDDDKDEEDGPSKKKKPPECTPMEVDD